MKTIFLTFFISFLTLKSVVVFAQVKDKNLPTDSTKIYQVELTDGSKFLGFILKKDTLQVVMKTSTIAKLELSFAAVKVIEEVEPLQIKDGRYWFENPHATRYLFGPSAINLKRGEKYYQNTWLFLNSFNIGVTDHFSIGGGVEFLTTFLTLAEGEFNPTFIITPKFGYEITEKVHAGGGVLIAKFPGAALSGIAYGVGTVGSLDKNFTGGLGWGFIDGSFASRPIITFSTMLRMSRKTAFVSENWVVPTFSGYYGVYSYGLRLFSEDMAVDLALLNNRDIASFLVVGLPYVSFTLKF
jgi:hypothetical protein